MEDRRCALEDVTVYKILEKRYSNGDHFDGLFSPVRRVKYEIGETYEPNFAVRPQYDYKNDSCSIGIGLHCYSEDNKIVVSTDGDITVIGGTRYGRFGDVIMDPEGYYWVCVRPSFAPINGECKSKGDSHWINIFNASYEGDGRGLPETNIKASWNKLQKYDKRTILLPTGLSYSREHIYNLTQLVWALIDPGKYEGICANHPEAALGGFPYTYNGKKFLRTVAAYWDELDIWNKLFNHSYKDMKNLDEINFFYQGYSWTFGETGYCWLYTSNGYQNSYTGKESNDKKQFNFARNGFDITHFAYSSTVELPWKNFYEKDNGKYRGTWVVRYKKGDDLMTAGKYDYYEPITSSRGLVNETYRYNEKKGINAGAEVVPETDETFVKPEKEFRVNTGSIIGSDYGLYSGLADAYAAGVQPIAIVVIAPDPFGGSIEVEYGSNYHYMAIALADVSPAAWAAVVTRRMESSHAWLQMQKAPQWTGISHEVPASSPACTVCSGNM